MLFPLTQTIGHDPGGSKTCGLTVVKVPELLNNSCWQGLAPMPFLYSCSTASAWEGVPINEIWDQTGGRAYSTILDRWYQLLADLR